MGTRFFPAGDFLAETILSSYHPSCNHDIFRQLIMEAYFPQTGAQIVVFSGWTAVSRAIPTAVLTAVETAVEMAVETAISAAVGCLAYQQAALLWAVLL